MYGRTCTNAELTDTINVVLLQQAKTDVTVVVFLIFPCKTNNFNVETLRGQAIAKQMRDTVEKVQKNVGKVILDKVLR